MITMKNDDGDEDHEDDGDHDNDERSIVFVFVFIYLFMLLFHNSEISLPWCDLHLQLYSKLQFTLTLAISFVNK